MHAQYNSHITPFPNSPTNPRTSKITDHHGMSLMELLEIFQLDWSKQDTVQCAVRNIRTVLPDITSTYALSLSVSLVQRVLVYFTTVSLKHFSMVIVINSIRVFKSTCFGGWDE